MYPLEHLLIINLWSKIKDILADRFWPIGLVLIQDGSFLAGLQLLKINAGVDNIIGGEHPGPLDCYRSQKVNYVFHVQNSVFRSLDIPVSNYDANQCTCGRKHLFIAIQCAQN